MTYASSVSTDMSAYEDLPGHHLLSIRNLIASMPDSSYPGSSDEESIPARGRMNPEWTPGSVISKLSCHFRL